MVEDDDEEVRVARCLVEVEDNDGGRRVGVDGTSSDAFFRGVDGGSIVWN